MPPELPNQQPSVDVESWPGPRRQVIDSWLPGLQSAIASTMNPVVAISEPGSYAFPQRTGEGFRCADHHITLRIHEAALGDIVARPKLASNQSPDCFELHAGDGSVLHRGYLSSLGDIERLRMLPAMVEAAEQNRAAGVAPIGCLTADGATLCAKVNDCAAVAGAEAAVLSDACLARHIDSVLIDGGQRRRSVLPRLGERISERVCPNHGLSVLHDVFEWRTEVTIASPVPGLLHARHGVLNGLAHGSGTVSLQLGSAMVAITTGGVAECWVTRPGTGPTLVEFYDQRGCCVLLVTRAGGADPLHAARWEHLTEMLSVNRCTH